MTSHKVTIIKNTKKNIAILIVTNLLNYIKN